MNEEPVQPEVTPVPWTAGDVFKRIPVGWLDAEIYLCSSVGTLTDVRRVSLQNNYDGRRFVVIHCTVSK